VVKLKLKLNKQQLAVAAVAALAVFAMTSTGPAAGEQQGTFDDAANRACTDFAAGYPQAGTETARLALADRVTASSAGSSHQPIAERAADLGSSANDGDAAWTASAEALAGACRDAGWQPTHS
jgi:hypothetical protein